MQLSRTREEIGGIPQSGLTEFNQKLQKKTHHENVGVCTLHPSFTKGITLRKTFYDNLFNKNVLIIYLGHLGKIIELLLITYLQTFVDF